MGEDHRDDRPSPDLHRFAHAFEEAQAFLAQMRGVDASVAGSDGRERHDLVQLGERAGQVLQPG